MNQNLFKSVLVKVYRHLQKHEQLKGFLCSLCPTSFEQFNQLRQHVATEHADKNGSTSRWYSKKTCDICSNVFATSKTLSKHIKAVHNRIKPFICNVCGYKSARKSTWEVSSMRLVQEILHIYQFTDFSIVFYFRFTCVNIPAKNRCHAKCARFAQQIPVYCGSTK